MDLSTIARRITNLFYRRLRAMLADVALIRENALRLSVQQP
jgi:hypothetical protein